MRHYTVTVVHSPVVLDIKVNTFVSNKLPVTVTVFGDNTAIGVFAALQRELTVEETAEERSRSSIIYSDTLSYRTFRAPPFTLQVSGH